MTLLKLGFHMHCVKIQPQWVVTSGKQRDDSIKITFSHALCENTTTVGCNVRKTNKQQQKNFCNKGAWWWFWWTETCSEVLYSIRVLCLTVYSIVFLFQHNGMNSNKKINLYTSICPHKPICKRPIRLIS